MAVRTYVPLSSVTLQRLFLWGVPSLTLLGLVGVAGVRLWLYRRRNAPPTTKTSTDSSSDIPVAAAACIQDAPPSSPGPPPIGERRASAPASTAALGQSKFLKPKKNSQETFQERFATPFKPSLGGKQLTSSNVHLPPLESEMPLKQSCLAATENCAAVPPANDSAIQGDSILEESVSSEGVLSLPCKSPPDITHRLPDTTEPVNHEKLSGRVSASAGAEGVLRQLKVDVEKPDGSLKDSNSLPLVSRKDRVRVLLQIPRNVVGRFIGKQGRNIKSLMQASNGAHVYVNQKNVPKDTQVVLCTVQGTSVQIKDAMNIIASKYPEIPIPPYSNTIVNGDGGLMQHMSPIPSPRFGDSVEDDTKPWEVELLPSIVPLNSFAGTICYLESPTDVWLVSSEKSVELESLHQNMSNLYCYTNFGRIDIKEQDWSLLGKYCAVRVSEIHWLRGRFVRFGDDPGSYEVQLTDYGSIVIVPPSAIKFLRRSHSRLPVQAFRAKLAHVELKEGIPKESSLISMQKMVEGMTLEIHIAGRLPWPSKATPISDNCGEQANRPRVSWPPSLDTDAITTSEAAPSNMAPPSETNPSNFESPPATGVHSNVSPDTHFDPGSLSDPTPSTTSCSSPSGPQLNPVARACPSPASASAQPTSVCPDAQPNTVSNTTTSTLHKQPNNYVELPPLAPYMPLVEIYTQLGAQTPVFVNRELVELGIASWKEERAKSS